VSAEEILKEVRSLGARVEVREDRLHIDAPEGKITVELKERLRQHKTEILRHLQLETRLMRHGISIAIDNVSGTALLVFSESDANGVQHVATIYKPYGITLTSAQRRELTAALDYYEDILKLRLSDKNIDGGEAA
jgi:TubC N-terminal docking domain